MSEDVKAYPIRVFREVSRNQQKRTVQVIYLAGKHSVTRHAKIVSNLLFEYKRFKTVRGKDGKDEEVLDIYEQFIS